MSQLVNKITMREADFNQFMRLRIQLVVAAEYFATEEILTSVLIPTTSKDMDEQLKLAHKVVDVVDIANQKVCLTLLRYNVDNPESSYDQVQLFPRGWTTRSFNKLYMRFINSKNSSIYLT